MSPSASLLARLGQALKPGGKGDRPPYVFESDGLATVHYSPFLDDDAFNARYRELRLEWFPSTDVDVRWRMWLLTQVARQCTGLDGDFAEFGVYRAGCSFMILSTGAFDDSKRFFLYDTFAGVPAEELSASEIDAELAGAHADTSVDYVCERLAPWSEQIVLVPGEVKATLRDADGGELAFVHMDLKRGGADPGRARIRVPTPLEGSHAALRRLRLDGARGAA